MRRALIRLHRDRIGKPPCVLVVRWKPAGVRDQLGLQPPAQVVLDRPLLERPLEHLHPLLLLPGPIERPSEIELCQRAALWVLEEARRLSQPLDTVGAPRLDSAAASSSSSSARSASLVGSSSALFRYRAALPGAPRAAASRAAARSGATGSSTLSGGAWSS